MKVLMTGATGLIGRALGRSLENDGHTIAALSRSPDKSRVPFADEAYAWQPEAGPPSAEAFAGAEVVIHLAGESVAGRRWNDEQKRRIHDSRVIGTRHLVAAMQALSRPPAAFICASAVGIYGDRGDELLDEQSPAGTGFLSAVCEEWEYESRGTAAFGVRVAQLRIGVVLSAEGGALRQMLPVFRLGLAGKLGSGRQWFPWIHVDDVVGIFRHVIESPATSGPVNVVAPGVVTNAEFTRELARALHRPAFFAAPEFGLKLMMGEMAAVVLASQRVVPKVALATGYSFRYPDLPSALAELFAESTG
ncbi:MAG TPA: TIGR01777 family oxidoreductase [Blastocatellia bacterium]|nr:TIGR01777 family oxidoreductase [Blastocatellia bacterium]